MDISSAEPGANAGEPKSNEPAKEANMSSEKASLEAGSSSGFTHSDPSSENPDVNKVLSYGPARRDDEAPEIKVDRTRT